MKKLNINDIREFVAYILLFIILFSLVILMMDRFNKKEIANKKLTQQEITEAMKEHENIRLTIPEDELDKLRANMMYNLKK